MNKLRVFVSSVQKELEQEREAVAQLISVDPFLLKHCEAVLYEYDPSTGRPSTKGYLDRLRECQIYVLLLGVEYGRLAGDLSATHEEYRAAQVAKFPTLVFIRDPDQKRKSPRQVRTKEFIEEIKRDGHKYVPFHDREDLRPAIRSNLYAVLEKEYCLKASQEESEDGDHQIQMASCFESQALLEAPWSTLDATQLSRFASAVIESPGLRVFNDAVCPLMHARGLLWRDAVKGSYFATAAGLLVFGARPADHFPQAEILVDAYSDTKITSKPRGQLNINAPILGALERVLEFIDKHTFHPTRIVGLNNIALDEYPRLALREALVNAMAHRTYEDASRKINVQVFSDRIVVASPGYPPLPLTLAKLRRGNYRACSRNPVIAQTLATLGLMEQRGSGFARMRDAMLNHGLDAAAFAEQDGYFVVTFPGPNGNYDKLKVPEGATRIISPSVEARLNDRQRRIVSQVIKNGSVTSGWCRRQFKVTYDTANRDFQALIELGVLQRKGRGPGTKYEMANKKA